MIDSASCLRMMRETICRRTLQKATEVPKEPQLEGNSLDTEIEYFAGQFPPPHVNILPRVNIAPPHAAARRGAAGQTRASNKPLFAEIVRTANSRK